MALGGAILGRWALPETILTVVFYVVGFLLYREPMTWNKIVGTAVCLVGLVIINYK